MLEENFYKIPHFLKFWAVFSFCIVLFQELKTPKSVSTKTIACAIFWFLINGLHNLAFRLIDKLDPLSKLCVKSGGNANLIRKGLRRSEVNERWEDPQLARGKEIINVANRQKITNRGRKKSAPLLLYNLISTRMHDYLYQKLQIDSCRIDTLWWFSRERHAFESWILNHNRQLQIGDDFRARPCYEVLCDKYVT